MAARRRDVLVRLLGHRAGPARDGRSDQAPPWNTEAHVTNMPAVLDARNLDRVELLAHSFGGLIALRLAHAAPERVGRIVLLDPSVGLPAGRMQDQVRQSLSSGFFADPE
ncbi:alpha/beta fold hydrolase [Streptomyces sp. NPDC006971]|uniref:alpha/beta fold hydrolase n=1 Tax=Streptomyces sp. NPDC006971 TaxID=3154784 RepID=UPI0033E1D456